MKTSDSEKDRVAQLLFADGRTLHRLANLKKGNASPKYDPEDLQLRAERTVRRRASRYADAFRGLVEKTR